MEIVSVPAATDIMTGYSGIPSNAVTTTLFNQLTDDFASFGTTLENTSNTSAEGQGPCDPGFGFQFYLSTIVVPLMCILGLAGNTISILVLQKDRHNRVAVFLLQSLAIADNSVLCLAFIALSVAYGLLPVVDPAAQARFRPYVLKFVNPLGNIAQSTVIWLTVLLAINRYIAICRPFTAKRWLTMTYARVQVGTVIAVSALLNVPLMLLYGSIPSGIKVNGCRVELDPPFNKTELGMNKRFQKIYLNGIYTSVVLILPLVLLVALNVPLIRQMQRSKRRMKRNSLSYSGRQENNITVVMVVIIAELIICHAPDRVAQIVRFIYDASVHIELPHPVFYIVNITNLLVLVNSSTDFIVYYVFRRRFRRILCDKLCCSTPPDSIPSPVPSEVGNGNAVCHHGNGKSRYENNSPRRQENETLKPFSLRDRYRLSKKRDSNQILLLKLHNIT